MSSTALLFLSALAVAASLIITKEHDRQKEFEFEETPSCQHFTQGLTFNDSQALGAWYLLHVKRDTNIGPTNLRCVEISLATNEERKNLSNLVGNYVGNLNWENLTLKMEFPYGVKDEGPYFLERIEGDGSYMTLLVSPPAANLHRYDIRRDQIRLKIIEGQYLGMMTCYQNGFFLLSKQPPQGTELDDRLIKIINSYWPEER